jgi:hypothetical protein
MSAEKQAATVNPGDNPGDKALVPADEIGQLYWWLNDGLLRARELLQSEATARDRASVALAVVIDFLRWHPGLEESGALVPLVHIVQALADLNQGTVAAMFKPSPTKGGRAPDSRPVLTVEVWSAATMTVLMKLGQTQKDAAKEVARVLHQRGRLKQSDATRVKNWRDKFRKDNKDWGTDQYWGVVKRLRMVSRGDAKFIVGILGGMLPGIPPTEIE